MAVRRPCFSSFSDQAAGRVLFADRAFPTNQIEHSIEKEKQIFCLAEKRNKKLAKAGIDPNKVNNIATMKTKNISSIANSVNKSDSNDAPKSTPKAGSIAAKANMVREYNEKNNK